jgi:hypothetical protein
MNDKTDFSFSVSVGEPTAPTGEDAGELIALDVCKIYRLSQDRLLVRNPRTGNKTAVRADVFSALTFCEPFRTRDEHTAELLRRTGAPPGQVGQIRQVLEDSLKGGLLVSATEICKALTAGEDAPGPDEPDLAAPDTAVIVVITWERPAALERLLASIRDNADLANIHRLYVVDDSRQADNIARNQDIVAAFGAQPAIAANYIGQRQQQRLLAEIARAVPQHERALRFLADQSQWTPYWTSGLARNLGLLLSAGRRAVVFDDDGLCELYEPTEAGAGVSINSQPREAAFFGQGGQWPGFRKGQQPDPVAGHLRCLGMGLAKALQQLGAAPLQPSSLAQATVKDVQQLHAASPLLLTQSGTLGHPGTVGNAWIVGLAGHSLERMLESTESVDHAIRNDNAWLGYRQPHFSPTSNMSAVTGLDNRQLLPPYFPALRNEDSLFGYMLSYLYPDLAVLDYPWATPHLPLDNRSRSAETTDFGIGLAFPTFFPEWVNLQKQHCLSQDPPDRLEHLAEVFLDLGKSASRELTEMYRDERAHFASDALSSLREASAAAGTAPGNWQAFLQKAADKLQADMAAGAPLREIRGTPRDLEGEALIELWRDYWREFGAALKAWPEIREAAREVMERGVEWDGAA